jgi:hypothetical protein
MITRLSSKVQRLTKLALQQNIRNLHLVLFHQISNIMVAHVNVLGSFMEMWVLGQGQSSLIVPSHIHRSSNILGHFEVSKICAAHCPCIAYIACEMYSDSQLDLATDRCFFDIQEKGPP